MVKYSKKADFLRRSRTLYTFWDVGRLGYTMRGQFAFLASCLLRFATKAQDAEFDDADFDLLGDDIALAGDDQIDTWEAIPLPPPSEADLIKDSDDLDHMHLSDAKRMVEKEELYFLSLGRAHTAKDEEAELEDLEAELLHQDRPGAQATFTEERQFPLIFNTDDFDDEWDDVPGDSPVAPPLA